MRMFGIFLLLIFATLFLPRPSLGQDDPGVFSGRGIDASRYQASQPKTSKLRWPKLRGFSNGERQTKKARPFKNLFAKNPNFEFWKNNRDAEAAPDPERARTFSGFSELFPKRNPDRPSMLEQLNTKSKTLFTKTSDWAQQTNDGLRSKSYETWNAITRDRSQAKDDSKRNPLLSRPPVRSVDSSPRMPKIRF